MLTGLGRSSLRCASSRARGTLQRGPVGLRFTPPGSVAQSQHRLCATLDPLTAAGLRAKVADDEDRRVRSAPHSL